MTRTRWLITILCSVLIAAVGATLAQRYYDRGSVPAWEVDKEFVHDVFTFVRVRYSSDYGGYGDGYGRGRGRGTRLLWSRRWRLGHRLSDSDLNFSYRLHQLTSMEVKPGRPRARTDGPGAGRLIRSSTCSSPAGWSSASPRSKRCGATCSMAGSSWSTIFWGEIEWYNFYREIKRVFPDREPVELPLSHPVFHAVFDLKEKPQIPSINVAMAGRDYGITWEREDAREVHTRPSTTTRAG